MAPAQRQTRVTGSFSCRAGHGNGAVSFEGVEGRHLRTDARFHVLSTPAVRSSHADQQQSHSPGYIEGFLKPAAGGPSTEGPQ